MIYGSWFLGLILLGRDLCAVIYRSAPYLTAPFNLVPDLPINEIPPFLKDVKEALNCYEL